MIHATQSRHLRRGDVVTEALYGTSVETRKIVVETVSRGDVEYRGERVPVYFVSGRDIDNGNDVRLTKVPAYRWAASRELAAVAA